MRQLRRSGYTAGRRLLCAHTRLQLPVLVCAHHVRDPPLRGVLVELLYVCLCSIRSRPVLRYAGGLRHFKAITLSVLAAATASPVRRPPPHLQPDLLNLVRRLVAQLVHVHDLTGGSGGGAQVHLQAPVRGVHPHTLWRPCSAQIAAPRPAIWHAPSPPTSSSLVGDAAVKVLSARAAAPSQPLPGGRLLPLLQQLAAALLAAPLPAAAAARSAAAQAGRVDGRTAPAINPSGDIAARAPEQRGKAICKLDHAQGGSWRAQGCSWRGKLTL